MPVFTHLTIKAMFEKFLANNPKHDGNEYTEVKMNWLMFLFFRCFVIRSSESAYHLACKGNVNNRSTKMSLLALAGDQKENLRYYVDHSQFRMFILLGRKGVSFRY